MKESKIILLESSVEGNMEPFPPKTTHWSCYLFPGQVFSCSCSESHYQSHYKVRSTPTVFYRTHAKTWREPNWRRRCLINQERVSKDAPAFWCFYPSCTHAIDNRNLCKQRHGHFTHYFCEWCQRIEQEMHWELAGGKAIFLFNKNAARPKNFIQEPHGCRG